VRTTSERSSAAGITFKLDPYQGSEGGRVGVVGDLRVILGDTVITDICKQGFW